MWKKRFDEKIGEWEDGMIDAQGMTGGISPDWHEVSDFIEEEIKKSLHEYSDWLNKKGYIDSDYYTEEPKAVDAFLNQLT